MLPIDRRVFLNWLGVGAVAPLLKLPRETVAPSPPPPPLREVVLLDAFVAGFQYHEGMKPDVFVRLEVGLPLVLRREPENRYDGNAIGVHTSAGNHLGYIPRAENEMLARMMDQQVPVGAKIVEIDSEAETWERVAVRIFVRMPTTGAVGKEEHWGN